MMSTKNLVKVMIVVFVICLFAKSDGKPIKRRSVAEIELMHDQAKLRAAEERRAWLRKLLQEMYNFSPSRPPVVDKIGASRRLPKREDNFLVESHKKCLGEADKADVDVLTKTKSQ